MAFNDSVSSRWLVALGVIAVLGCGAPQTSNAEEQTSSDVVNKQSGYTVVVDENQKYWFSAPDGTRFLSLGINNISPTAWNPKPDTQYYDAVNTQFGGDESKWGEWVVQILKGSAFNTFACWSDSDLKGDGFVHTPCLYVAGHARERCLDGLRPGFEDRVRTNALEILKQYSDRDRILGVFLDNEMPWYGRSGWDDLATFTLLEFAFQLPSTDPAREAARQFLIERYITPDAMAKAWGGTLASWDDLTVDYLRDKSNDVTRTDREEFTRHVAKAFFEPSTRIVRDIFPNALILGVRFAGRAPEAVIRECGTYCDILSFNNYQGSTKPDAELIAKYWLWGKRPMMITEYSWRAEENQSGNPNTGGAGSVVKTQKERADNYRDYVTNILSYPMILGAHWFEFADQSPQGRFDGENSNYGVVDIHNKPYTELLNAMKETNRSAVETHASSTIVAPDRIPEPQEVVFEPGQHPDRPPSIDLIHLEPVHPHTPFYAGDASAFLQREGESLVLVYDTGQEWGCGVSFFGPKSMASGSGTNYATDLDGYTYIKIDAEVPEGLRFEVIIDEGGVAPPNEAYYDTSAGDDGESFTFETAFGKGVRSVYTFDLHELHPRKAWGNQYGRKRVDVSAIKGIGIVIPGVQGSAKIRFHSLELSR